MSLLLDALKQAEANKKAQQDDAGLPETAALDTNITERQSQSEDENEQLVDLEILPEFDLSPLPQESSEPAFDSQLTLSENEAETPPEKTDSKPKEQDNAPFSEEDDFAVSKTEPGAIKESVEPKTPEAAMATATHEKPEESWPAGQAIVAAAVLQQNVMARLGSGQWTKLIGLSIIGLMLLVAYLLWQYSASGSTNYYHDTSPATASVLETGTPESGTLTEAGAGQLSQESPQNDVNAASVNESSNVMQWQKREQSPNREVSAIAEENVPVTPRLQIKIKRTQPRVNAVLMDAYRLYRQHHYQQAQELYQKVLAMSPDNLDAMLGLGGIAEQQQDEAAARYWYEKVLQKDRTQAFAWAALIRLDKHKSVAEKQRFYQAMIEQQPENPAAYAALAGLYLQQRQWRLAQALFFKAIEYDQRNPLYYYNLAVCLDHMQKPELALRYYRQARILLKDTAESDIIQRIDNRLKR